jgi:hypothetical protein
LSGTAGLGEGELTPMMVAIGTRLNDSKTGNLRLEMIIFAKHP